MYAVKVLCENTLVSVTGVSEARVPCLHGAFASDGPRSNFIWVFSHYLL